jgi:hypothetical protein
MKKYPKHIRVQLRKLMDRAYEQELSHELSQLANQFDSWKAEEISAGELNHLIHRYHDDRARELYKYYNSVSPDLAVARGVVAGWLTQEMIPDEIWSYIEVTVQFLRHEE